MALRRALAERSTREERREAAGQGSGGQGCQKSASALCAAGLDISPRPIPDAGKQAATLAERWPVFLRLGEETTKVLYYKARGWI
jgi:hypothetical protein